MIIYKYISLSILVFLCSCSKNVVSLKEKKIIENKIEKIRDEYTEIYGYVVLEFENKAIYSNFNSYHNNKIINGQWSDGIWLDIDDVNQVQPFQGKVIGKLVEGRVGHKGMYTKKLIDIQVYDLKGNKIN